MVAIRCCFFEGYFMARRSLRRVAMPFLQASLVKQILIGLILGIALAYLAPEAAKACAFLGSLFIAALKAVAPLLVFVGFCVGDVSHCQSELRNACAY